APPLRDAFVLAAATSTPAAGGPDAAPGPPPGTFHGFDGPAANGGRGGERIDLVLVGKGLEAEVCRIDRRCRDGRYPSDHYPVLARLRWWPMAPEPSQDGPRSPAEEVASDPASPLR
ncbi:MAG: hypothetical protein KDA22_02925, partial [Phycisphaerales bacterium]|nr:hypothetical protein [Phycisphaerales bacterium]